MKQNPVQYRESLGMIISCPSCQTSFRVDAARLGPSGKKVRCSKCGHVWHAAPIGATGQEASPAQVSPAQETSGQSPVIERVESGEDASRPRPVLTARAPDEEGIDTGISAEGGDGDDDSASAEEVGDDGLTGEQRAKLAAARQKKQPRGSGFWIKILLIFIIVVGLLLVAQKMGMLPSPNIKNAGPPVEQPANDVGPVDAKPLPANPESGQVGGHIVGDTTATEPKQPAQ